MRSVGWATMLMVVLDGERAVVSTLAGGVSGATGAFFNGVEANAGFNEPQSVAVDASGNVFVADRANQRIRMVTAGGGMLMRDCCSHELSCLYSMCGLGCTFLSARACVHLFAPVYVCPPVYVCLCKREVCMCFGICVSRALHVGLGLGRAAVVVFSCCWECVCEYGCICMSVGSLTSMCVC
jgi:hypothetical protein